jgi:hypothetical protein
MALKVTNNASTTIAGSINAAATAINLAGGTGSLFPVLSGSDWFWGTLVDASNNIEVIKVTARSTDALTVTRGQDGTTAKSYTVGDRFELRPTAALFNDKADIDNPSFTTKITTPAITLGATALTATGAELNYVAGVTSAIQTQINGIIPSGTVMSFFQAAAPTGWTQVVTQNNKALRVVSGTGGGTGGTVAFTTAFASQTPAGTVGNTTLTTSQIPAHTHSTSFTNITSTVAEGGTGTILKYGSGDATGSQGGGTSHTHSFTGTAINLAVQYIDMIIASKN